MNRDELLTKLAMDEPPESWGSFERVRLYEGHVFGWNEYQLRRAELINNPSWDNAPEWAKWLAQDAPGAWFWFQDEPSVSDDEKWDDPRSGRVRHASSGFPVSGHDWTQTLEKRPAFNETRADTIGQNGNDGQHYMTEDERSIPAEEKHDCLRCGGSYYSPPHDECPCQSGRSDGSTASCYELPPGATELQDLISYRNLNAQDGEIFRAVYRKGRASHSDALRDAKKVLFYAEAEVRRLEAYGK